MSDQNFFDELLKQMDEAEALPKPLISPLQKPPPQPVVKIPEKPKIEKRKVSLEAPSDQFIKPFDKKNQEVKPAQISIVKRLKMLFMRAKNKHIGEPIYLGENGDLIGTVVDVKRNNSGKIVSYIVSDDAGIAIHLPVKKVEEFDDGLMLQPAWYIEGRRILRQLKLQEKMVSDIAFMQASGDISEERISEILGHAEPRLKDFIEESKRMTDNLKTCHDNLEKERVKLSKRLNELIEKRLLGSIRYKDFAKELLVLKRKAMMLDTSIEKSNGLSVSLDSSPFLIYYKSEPKDIRTEKPKTIVVDEDKAKKPSLIPENVDKKLREEMDKLKIFKEEMKMLKIEPRKYPSDETEDSKSFSDMAKIFDDSIKRLNTDLGKKEPDFQSKEEKKDAISSEMAQRIKTTKKDFSDFVKTEILSKLETKRRQKDVDLNALAELDQELGTKSEEHKAEVRKTGIEKSQNKEEDLLAELVRDSALEFIERTVDDDSEDIKEPPKKKERTKK